MSVHHLSNDTYSPVGTDITVNRMGYGAMQLAGPHVFGPPKDRAAAIAVLRKAVELGINHIDTSDFYGPHVTNQIIKDALHPYASDLTIVTKIGHRRGEDGSWIPAPSPAELTSAVHDNLRNLGLETLDIVNLRAQGLGAPEGESLDEAIDTLVALQKDGLIRHIGLSQVNAKQIADAQKKATIVCVQNHYNIAHRHDEALIDVLAQQGIAYVPYFPLGGFTPLQSDTLNRIAATLQTSPNQVALAWLLQRSPNILVIPGTSSIAHLQENVAAATLQLDADALSALNSL